MKCSKAVCLFIASRYLLAFIVIVFIAGCHSAVVKLSPDSERISRDRVVMLHLKKPVDLVAGLTISPVQSSTWAKPLGKGTDSYTSFQLDVRMQKLASEDQQLHRPGYDALVMTVWDWQNRPVQQVEIEIPGRAAHQRIDFHVKGKGAYLLTFDGFQTENEKADSHVFRIARSFCVYESAASTQAFWQGKGKVQIGDHASPDAGRFFVGICGFPGRDHWGSGGAATLPAGWSEKKARDYEATLMQESGFGLVRPDVSMVLQRSALTNKKEDAKPIDWSRMDAAVNAYTSRGFLLDLQLMNPPDWAVIEKYKNVKGNYWRYPHVEQVYRRYVRELVSRYGKHAAFVQVFNEPDQKEFWAGTKQEFVQTFEQAHDEINKASTRLLRMGAIQTRLTTTNGGYAFIDPAKTAYFVDELKGKIDLIAYHSHGNLRELIRDHEHAKKLHEAAGYDQPRFINTETGFSAWRLDQEQRQAQAMLHKLYYSWATGHEGVMLFASRMTRAPGREGRDFGLLDYNFCPRFAYGAVAAFMKTMAGAKFVKAHQAGKDVFVYEFHRGNEVLVSVFSVGQQKQVQLKVGGNSTKRVQIIDAMGNMNVLTPASGGAVMVVARAYPQTLVFDGAKGLIIDVP
jgi:hypothetical protein